MDVFSGNFTSKETLWATHETRWKSFPSAKILNREVFGSPPLLLKRKIASFGGKHMKRRRSRGEWDCFVSNRISLLAYQTNNCVPFGDQVALPPPPPSPLSTWCAFCSCLVLVALHPCLSLSGIGNFRLPTCLANSVHEWHVSICSRGTPNRRREGPSDND